MKIITDRLQISDLSPEDLSIVHRLLTTPEVTRYNTLPVPEDEKHTQRWIDQWVIENKSVPRKNYTLTIKLTATNQEIGLLGLKLHPRVNQGEAWYKIHPGYWRSGYGSEALQALLRFGFEALELHRIEAGTAVENTASWKVMEKAGMNREATRRKALYIAGTWHDHYQYGILKEDFNSI